MQRETKPKVWAFLLWKAAQRSDAANDNANSWKLYQVWVKLDEAIRETWIVAGRTIQSFARVRYCIDLFRVKKHLVTNVCLVVNVDGPR